MKHRFEIFMRKDRGGSLISNKPRELILIETVGTIESDGESSPLADFISFIPSSSRVKITVEYEH